jgi:LytS/YehU family sensor histidine kinase
MSASNFKDFFGNRYYFLFSFVLGIPVWIANLTYVNSLDVSDSETVATGLTICFFIGVFAGRYLAHAWVTHFNRSPRNLIIGLSLLIVACISWMIFHVRSPRRDQDAANLFLYALPFIIISLATGMTIKLIRSITQKQLMEARTAAAQSKGELQLLQSQLSPHFLFNTLNNLYGLSITQHEKIPPLLLRLSDLLRYSVYEAGETYVPLKMELDYINNYIEFEKIRMGSRLMLTTEIQVPSTNDIKIAPMLLIVFVENAFKYAGDTAAKQSFIDIKLATESNLIIFRVSNSYSKEKAGSKLPGKNSGMGLTNVYKRLELLYPAEHILEIQEEEEKYTITLQLKSRK